MSTEIVAAKMGAGQYAKPLEDVCIRFGITSTLRKCHFLAQVAHESDSFRTATEYASGAAYEGRKDLGNIRPGDGRRFRGRGLIQLTGRANYAEYSMAVYGDPRCVDHPEMLSELPDAALAAGWFWETRGLNRWADKDDVVGVTKRINGGTNGLEDRKAKLVLAKRLFAELTNR